MCHVALMGEHVGKYHADDRTRSDYFIYIILMFSGHFQKRLGKDLQ